MTDLSDRPVLGQVVRSRRIALGMSQEELADRVTDLGSDIKQTDISRIERGKVELPRRRRLEHIAAALGLSLGGLLAASGWAGTEELLAGPAVASAVNPPLPAITPDPITARNEREWAPSARPRHAGPDPEATLHAVLQLRAAVARAQEPVDRAVRLLRACQETARRWDHAGFALPATSGQQETNANAAHSRPGAKT